MKIIGWIGIVVLILGIGTFIQARKDAEDLIDTVYANPPDGMTGYENLSVDDKMAKDSGYDSYEDYVTHQNRNSGAFWAFVGLILTSIGIKKK